MEQDRRHDLGHGAASASVRRFPGCATSSKLYIIYTVSDRTTQVVTGPATNPGTPAEWQVLHILRRRYRQDRDLVSDRERARRRFVRWIDHSGRLVP
jgi:hypothetical protein